VICLGAAAAALRLGRQLPAAVNTIELPATPDDAPDPGSVLAV
jgi:hypothetical protein